LAKWRTVWSSGFLKAMGQGARRQPVPARFECARIARVTWLGPSRGLHFGWHDTGDASYAAGLGVDRGQDAGPSSSLRTLHRLRLLDSARLKAEFEQRLDDLLADLCPQWQPPELPEPYRSDEQLGDVPYSTT
jgi:hypothetical protein